ncbi:MAG: hypothetical protein NVS4B2_33200 [Chloroflexota bacterium]
MGRRSDTPLIKHLSKEYNPRLGWEWQRLPLVELPVTHAGEWVAMGGHVRDMRASGQFQMPFDDFVLDGWFYDDDDDPDHVGLAAEPEIHSWIRVSTGPEYARSMERLSPWDLAFKRNRKNLPIPDKVLDATRAENAFLVVESWSHFPLQDEWMGSGEPFVIYLLRDGPDGLRLNCVPMSYATAAVALRAKNEAKFAKIWDDILHSDCDNAINTALYLTTCPEYLVEEQPEIPPSAKPRRQNDPKPWTYEYLPRIILLDPTEAPSGETKPHQGGTHASPRPHQRRGHWSELRHPKYRRSEDGSTRKVFVKPAWVGPREWIMQGNHYRVLTAQGGAQ